MIAEFIDTLRHVLFPVPPARASLERTDQDESAGLAAVLRRDGWKNLVNWIGTSYDPMGHHKAYSEPWLELEQIENLYYSDPYAQRIVRDPVEAAFRQGWNLVPPGDVEGEVADAQARAIADLLWERGAVSKLVEALCWGRRDGRGALLLGVNDGSEDVTRPLDYSRISELAYLEVLECGDFSASTYEDNPMVAGFGEPATWRINRRGGTSIPHAEVHTSRLIVTRGVPTSRQKRHENNWRDASVLQACYRYLRGWDSSVQSLARMLADSSQAVLSIDGLNKMVNEASLLTNRLRVLELARAMRIMPVDAAREKFDFIERTFTGVDKVMEMQLLALAGAAGGIPLVVLVGRSPSGLSVTSEGDVRIYYDRIASDRRTIYQPMLEQLVYLAALVTGADQPERWGVSWPSLWQMTATEEAEHRDTVAQTDISLIEAGVLGEDEVATHRFGEGGWGTEIVVNWDERSAGANNDFDDDANAGDERADAGDCDDFDDERMDADEDELDAVFAAYHRVVNMGASELERWSETECSKLASKSRAPIRRNIRLLRKKKAEWTNRDIRDANRTISFVSRMRNVEQGDPAREGCPSKRDIALKNWAFDPSK